jgi:hypothetical protein
MGATRPDAVSAVLGRSESVSGNLDGDGIHLKQCGQGIETPH